MHYSIHNYIPEYNDKKKVGKYAFYFDRIVKRNKNHELMEKCKTGVFANEIWTIRHIVHDSDDDFEIRELIAFNPDSDYPFSYSKDALPTKYFYPIDVNKKNREYKGK